LIFLWADQYGIFSVVCLKFAPENCIYCSCKLIVLFGIFIAVAVAVFVFKAIRTVNIVELVILNLKVIICG
jgi:hypothetical protein